jgi:nitroreductase
MDIIEAVKARKSIRAYLDRPVARSTLEEIMDIAVRAPSSMNTQPWEFVVLTGDVLTKIKDENVKLLESGATPNPEVQGGTYEGVYKQRQIDLAKQLFGLLEISKGDKEKRTAWTKQGFRFFDAPAAIIAYCDKSLSFERSMYDVGAVVQTICLVALNYGLATCIQGQGIMYPEVVRKYTKLPDSKRLVICVTIGYPDMDFPGNKIDTERTPAADIVKWIGFD